MSFTDNQYEQGDIVWVKYPFSDQPEKSKARPAVVVSHERSNRLDHDLVIIPITSRIRNDAFSFPLTPDYIDNALPQISEARCNKVVTVRGPLIDRKITQLNSAGLALLIEKVCTTFQLNLPSELSALDETH